MVEDDIKERVFKYWSRRYPVVDGIVQISGAGTISGQIKNIFGLEEDIGLLLWDDWLTIKTNDKRHPLHFIEGSITLYFLATANGGDNKKLHREDGPARIVHGNDNIDDEHYIRGECIPEADYKKIYNIKTPK